VTVLILGGTAEARALAARLAADSVPVVSSLAGRVREPRLPAGEVHIGGFGGVDGLCAYLAEQNMAAVVDATHPFAARISANADQACARTGLPLLRLVRPGWGELPGAHRWQWVDSDGEAAAVAADGGDPVVLTTGRQTLEAYVRPLHGHRVLARVVDPPGIALPDGWVVVRSRGPYDLEAERALLLGHGAEVLVTKDSGGSHTRAKLDAADEFGVTVVVIRRPPEAHTGVADVEAAMLWLQRVAGVAGVEGVQRHTR